MEIEIAPARLDDVRPLRDIYKRELDDLVRYEAAIRDGKCDLYVIGKDGQQIGYGIVQREMEPQGAVIEFFLSSLYRVDILPIFSRFVVVSNATGIAARTNDSILAPLLYGHTVDVSAPTIFFRDDRTTHHLAPRSTLRTIELSDTERLAPILCRPESWPFDLANADELRGWITRGVGWVLERDGDVLGLGAIYDHYNPPFADLAMWVVEPYRKQGFGAYILQELKRRSYEAGLVPTARCHEWNIASRNTLHKAGFFPNARLLIGTVA
jgi:GNAT superfamily N-acetyltransferase